VQHSRHSQEQAVEKPVEAPDSMSSFENPAYLVVENPVVTLAHLVVENPVVQVVPTATEHPAVMVGIQMQERIAAPFEQAREPDPDYTGRRSAG